MVANPLRRLDIRAILRDPILRRAMMVPAIKAIQNREGINTTLKQAAAAYDKVQNEMRKK